MKSIKAESIVELVINKSTFINYLIPVNSLKDVQKEQARLIKKYRDASHHCFAYILGDNQEIQKYSDDGEPSKTAGYPMIEVLKKHDLTNILNVSVRYYGGIKLGAGGLTRAYTKGCASSIKKAKFSYLVNYIQVTIEIPFHHIGNVEKYLRDNFQLLDTQYGNYVSYIINIKTADSIDFKTKIKNFTKGESHCEILYTFKKYE